jgi:SAM-dependent methyltransferase
VVDDPQHPDPGLAELYASLPDAEDLEPWLSWCQRAEGEVLYLGAGAGRLAVPLAAHGVLLVAVDSHPGMLERLAGRAPGIERHQERIEDLDLGRAFELVMAPSNILVDETRLARAARHVAPHGRLGFELMNPHWLAGGGGGNVRVLFFQPERCRLEVDYPGGFTHRAEVRLVWPGEIEDFLAGSDLSLVVMRGSAEDLESSPTFTVLARR